MNRIRIYSLIILFLGLGFNTLAQPPGKKIITLEEDGQAAIKFEVMSHNFDTIVAGTQAIFEFEYTNTGKGPLIITDVKPPCDCTHPEWPKEPLAPGKSAKIKVRYDSKDKSGSFSKTIEIKHNGESMREFITIKGFVKPS
jgi:hypothetical protein